MSYLIDRKIAATRLTQHRRHSSNFRERERGRAPTELDICLNNANWAAHELEKKNLRVCWFAVCIMKRANIEKGNGNGFVLVADLLAICGFLLGCYRILKEEGNFLHLDKGIPSMEVL